MVRFAWSTGNGALAYAKRKQVSVADGTRCLQFAVDVELAGKHSLAEVPFILPPSWSASSKVHELGVFIAPGALKVDSNDTLCRRLAISLAKAGHLVVRSPFEVGSVPNSSAVQKVLEAAITSPYASGVRQWVLVGYSLAGIALARAGLLAGERVAGFCLISYPLQHELTELESNASKAPLGQTLGPILMHLRPPVLLVQPDSDEAAPVALVMQLASAMRSSDVRMLPLKDTDHALRVNKQPVARSTLRKIVKAVAQFMAGLREGSLEHFPVESIRRMANQADGQAPALSPNPNPTQGSQMKNSRQSDSAQSPPQPRKLTDDVLSLQRRNEEARKKIKLGRTVEAPSPRHRELEDLEDLIPDDMEGGGSALELQGSARRGIVRPDSARIRRDTRGEEDEQEGVRQEIGRMGGQKYEEPALGYEARGDARDSTMGEYQRAEAMYGQRHQQQEEGGMFQHPGGGMYATNSAGMVGSGSPGVPRMQQPQLHELGAGQITAVTQPAQGQSAMLGGRHPEMGGMHNHHASFYTGMAQPPTQPHYSGMPPGQMLYGWGQSGAPPHQQQHMHPGYDANGVPSGMYDPSGRQFPPGANYLNYQYMQRYGQ